MLCQVVGFSISGVEGEPWLFCLAQMIQLTTVRMGPGLRHSERVVRKERANTENMFLKSLGSCLFVLFF